MILPNKNFDAGHHEQGNLLTNSPPFSDCVVPNHWFLYWLDETKYPGFELKTARPESVVWNINGAPDNEKWMFLSPPYNWKIFKAWRPLYSALQSSVGGLIPGQRYKFTINVIPDIVKEYDGGKKVAPDEWAAEVRLGVSSEDTVWPQGEDGDITWQNWHAKGHENDGFPLEYLVWNTIIFEFTATAQTMKVWVELKAKYGIFNNFFLDNVNVVPANGAAPPPEPTGTASKLGPHVVKFNKGSRTSELCSLGPAVVKLVGEWGYSKHIPERSLIIGRMYDAPDVFDLFKQGKPAKEAAEIFIAHQLETYQNNPLIKWWEGPNELHFDDNLDWYALFECERMRQMADLGLHCVIGNFSTGTPKLEHWPLFLTACATAHRRYKGILGLHEYSCPWMWWMTGKYQLDPSNDQGDTGYTTLRYRKVYREHLEPNDIHIPIIITETGIDPLVRPKPDGCEPGTWKQLQDYWRENHDGEVPYIDDPAEYYFRQLKWYEAELAKDDYIIGACLFTHGSYKGSWRAFDVANTEVEDKVIDHIKANPPKQWVYPEHPEPPDPPIKPCRGAPRRQYKRTYVLLPPVANKEWASAVVNATWNDKRYTIGSSADDAGIGDLDERYIIAVNPHLWPGPQTLDAFLTEHYPGVSVIYITAETPEELLIKLSSPDPTEPVNEILLGQKDNPWGLQRYALGRCSTFAAQGCWITNCAMTQRYYGIDKDATPLTVDQTVGSEGYTANCLMKWSAMPPLGLKVLRSTTRIEEVSAHLQTGGVCFAEVAPSTYQHFVLVTKVSEHGRFWMYDPLKRLAGWLDDHYSGVDSWRLILNTELHDRIHPIVGIHDLEGADWMMKNGIKGWCCVPLYLGTSPQSHDWRLYQDAGINIIANWRYGWAKDDGGKGTMPGPDKLSAFETAVIESMHKSQGIWGHVYCNEFNNRREHPEGYELTPTYYGQSFNRVSGNKPANAKLSPGAIDPFNAGWGDWRISWKQILNSLYDVDFIALHAYDHGTNADPDMIFGDDPLKGVYYNLRVLESQLEILPTRWPVIITETNHLITNDGKFGWENSATWPTRAFKYFTGINQVLGACLYRMVHDEWSIKDKPEVLKTVK